MSSPGEYLLDATKKEVRVTDPTTGGMKGSKQEQWSLVEPAYRRSWLFKEADAKGVPHGHLGLTILLASLDFEEGKDEAAATMLLYAKDTCDARTLANIYGMGSRKYDRGNWRKGYAWSLTLDALWRHTIAWTFDGELNDPESGLPHAGHGLWHCSCLNDFIRLRLGTDDRLWRV